jgi:hypothetical protein
MTITGFGMLVEILCNHNIARENQYIASLLVLDEDVCKF